MLSRIITILIALFIVPSAIMAQWEEHFTYSNCTYGGICKDGVFAGNTLDFFKYDPSELTISKYSKVNYLSSVNIATVSYSDGVYLVGYSDGLIDIIDEKDNTTNSIVDLKTTNNLSLKSINALYKHGNSLYCAFESGLLEINIAKKETKGYYRLSSQLTAAKDVLAHNGSIYVATSRGIMTASLNSSVLEDTRKWDIVSNNTSAFCKLMIANDKIYAAQGTIGGTCVIYRINDDNTLSKIRSVSSFRGMDTYKNQVVFASQTNLAISDIDNLSSNISTVSKYTFSEDGVQTSVTPNIRSVSIIKENMFLCADASNGMVITDAERNAERHLPNAPSNSYVYDIKSSNGVLYASFGGWDSANNNLNRTAGVHIYNDGEWNSYTTSGRDLIHIATDPNRPDSVYVSAWGTGVLKLEHDGIKIRYNEHNSPLEDIFAPDRGYNRCSALAYDNESNLYVTNAEVSIGIKIKLADGTWTEGVSYVPTDFQHSTKQLICTKNGNMWLVIPRTNYRGLMVFNINHTPEIQSDDMYRTTVTISEPEPTYMGKLPLLDQDGKEISALFNTVAEDKNGIIWMGTTDGIFRCSQNDVILKDPARVQHFEHVKVPRNDGTNSADYLLAGANVSCILVDTDNRKWVGTESDGLYLISSDGMKMLEHFTADNSPLPSNQINALTIDENTGKLYISSGSYGIVAYQTEVHQGTEGKETINIKIYPNPITPSFTGDVTIEGLPEDSDVRISDVQGRLVYNSKSNDGAVYWNLARFGYGARVATGVYIVWIQTLDGEQKAVGKIVVVK